MLCNIVHTLYANHISLLFTSLSLQIYTTTFAPLTQHLDNHNKTHHHHHHHHHFSLPNTHLRHLNIPPHGRPPRRRHRNGHHLLPRKHPRRRQSLPLQLRIRHRIRPRMGRPRNQIQHPRPSFPHRQGI